MLYYSRFCGNKLENILLLEHKLLTKLFALFQILWCFFVCFANIFDKSTQGNIVYSNSLHYLN